MAKIIPMKSFTWTVGNIKITSVVEIEAGGVIQKGIPNATKENISKIPWLAPSFADSDGNLKALVRAFVVETEDARIIVDPCVGNNKARNDLPEWRNLETDFLHRLEQQGYARDLIDIVLCTHLHFDREQAVITGDVIHHPCQIAYPD